MLALNRVSKSFPGVRALADVTFTVAGGEIHALAGENGAGKSTLTKIIAGASQPDAGDILFEGHKVRWQSPAHAQRCGVQVIYQELVLFPNLSVAENIFIGHERRGPFGTVSAQRTHAEARRVLEQLAAGIDPAALVGELSIADRQMVEIAKALVRDVKVLILDEPTAVISGCEVVLLFNRLRALRETGVGIIYISHRLDEIFDLADRVTVLKDGAVVGTRPTAAVTRDSLITMMVGRDLGHLFPARTRVPSERRSLVRARGISVANSVKDVSLELFSGEITALAGLAGAGRTELALGIFGGLPMTSGSLTIDDVSYESITPAKAISLGIGLVTEDRQAHGLAMQLDIAANVTASQLPTFSHQGFLSSAAETQAAQAAIDRYHVSCRGPRTPVAALSGGNQQKLLIARWAGVSRRLLILDEPTRGVDVGAKQEIYKLIQELANTGIAVLMISSELPEVVGMADRVIVMREGIVAGELSGADISEECIMRLAAHQRRPRPETATIESEEPIAHPPHAVA